MRATWTGRSGPVGRAAPLARQKITSPSKGVCAGRMARARPSCAIMAIRLHSGPVRSALTAMTQRVVAAPGCERQPPPMRECCGNGSSGGWAKLLPSCSYTDPTGLTAASAPTVRVSERLSDAEPIPPGRDPARAPRPAPTLPSAKQAAGTMGIGGRPGPSFSPSPRPLNAATTPSAAARPNTDPPDSEMACARPTRRSPSRRSRRVRPSPGPR
eukprot:gene17133-17324_t